MFFRRWKGKWVFVVSIEGVIDGGTANCMVCHEGRVSYWWPEQIPVSELKKPRSLGNLRTILEYSYNMPDFLVDFVLEASL